MTQFTKRTFRVISLLTLVGVVACDPQEARDLASAPGAHAHEHAEDGHAVVEPAADDHAAEEHSAHQHINTTPTSLDELPEGVNAVQHEMRLLNEAMHTTLTLIANNQLGGIPALIHRVHSAKELTHSAIEAGVYLPPKNPDRIDAFVEMDNVFHDDLRELLRAAKADDLQRATDAYGELVQGCTSCHTAFRY